MFSSHVKLGTMTWGDLFRLKKYYRMYSKWGDRNGVRMYLVFPNLLIEDDYKEFESIFFLKEKNIVQEMFLSFYENKELDQINYELPIDFLSFVRYFTYDILTKQINK